MKVTRRSGGSIADRLAAYQQRDNLLPIEELQSGYTPQLQDALAQLAEVAGKINVVELVTATNHNHERDIWMEQAWKGKYTIPNLEYDRSLLRETYSQCEHVVGDLAPQLETAVKALPDGPVGYTLGELAKSRLHDVITSIELAGNLLHGNAFEAARRITALYGTPSNFVVKQARQEIERRKAGPTTERQRTILTDAEREQLKAIKLDAAAICRTFRWTAEQYGFADTRPIVVSNQATAPDVRDVSSNGPIVVVPADYTATGLSVVPIAIHEVGCHWRDSENMQKMLPGLGAGGLKPVDELLYEGHAVARGTDTKLALQGYMQLRWRIYYPVAIWMASREDKLFNETAEELFKLIRTDWEPIGSILDDVWRVTYRIYRGNPHLGVRNGYAYTKDRAYYGGQVLAQELRQAGLDYLLDYGTLKLSDLELLASRFDLRPQQGMPYPDQADMAQKLCEKLLQGDFILD